jgi:hypothetical protein
VITHVSIATYGYKKTAILNEIEHIVKSDLAVKSEKTGVLSKSWNLSIQRMISIKISCASILNVSTPRTFEPTVPEGCKIRECRFV